MKNLLSLILTIIMLFPELATAAGCEEYEAEAEAISGVVPRFNADGRLRSILIHGEATFLTNKRSLVNAARTKAELSAKQAFSSFLNESVSAAQKARISAGSILVKQKKLEETAVKQELQQKVQEATALYIQYKKALDSYHKKGLPGAAQLMQAATQKLTAGDINYLDWVVLMNQSIQTRADYYNAVMSYNEAAFELEKLNSIQ